MTLDTYRDEVSRLLHHTYALTWQDASGEDELLARALNAGESPRDFVRWFAEKYDLTPRDAFAIIR